MTEYFDMHMHLGFTEEPRNFAENLEKLDVYAFSNTVTPQEYIQLHQRVSGIRNIRLGLGFHPWWVKDLHPTQLDALLKEFDSVLESTSYVGEIGLDYWPTRVETKDTQLYIFEHIIQRCSALGNKLISIHSVKADSVVLDIIESHACLESNTCILHSYGGSSNNLSRAIKQGFYFSVSPRMLKSKRGKEYARIIPESQLLIETDLPSSKQNDCKARNVADALQDVIATLANLRDTEQSELIVAINSTSSRLLKLHD